MALRPWKPEYDARVVEMGMQGKSWCEIAEALGVNLEDIAGMIASEPSFARAADSADEAAWQLKWLEGAKMLESDDSRRMPWKAWEASIRVRWGDAAFRKGVRPSLIPTPPPEPKRRRQWRPGYGYYW